MAEILVLGAGIVGVCAGLALQERGHAVSLIDRDQPGHATSFGNAGIIQSEAVEPYAMPLARRDLLAIAAGRSNDVRWCWRALLEQGKALAAYARHSRPTAHTRAIATYRRLIPQACTAHAPLIRAAGAEDLIRRQGYLELYRSTQALDGVQTMAMRFRAEYGVGVALLDGAALRRAEPAIRADLPGALHWADCWTVTDPAALTLRYADLFVRRGGQLLRGDAAALDRAGSGWRLSLTDGESVQAEHVVIALGPWSPAVLARFGLSVPMVLKRGYHRHYTATAAPDHVLVDAENGIVLAPMRAGLRICTGADLAARPDADPPQLRRGEAAATQLLGPLSPAEPGIWSGRRPCMPDMLPVIGAVPGQPGLWANFGHGHHGLTLAAVSGGILADMVEGQDAYPTLSPARLA
ncbi:FAD-dependent oxidoreductase [Paracoccus sp. M683]|uniref:NAD(P)/FAD-dependent oxidoreductase n=1 Tax=Paracoccus sp. M683 TaxID=2594268 RepID=UPI00117EDD36|nr:FAD-dependent oxidoreductase [Paracoccus sp. M683]TRW96730.1 FAD-dependent oxidoreductase [Paracoccus sp. M683]